MKVRHVAYVVCLTVILGLLATAACADTVWCKPLLRKGVVVGFCFIVCNRDWEDICDPQGCIWDLHLRIRYPECKFTRIIKLPPGWSGVINGPAFAAKTPGSDTQRSNPIPPSRCYRFCLGVNWRECLSRERCMKIWWVTTDMNGRRRDSGITRCCLPLKQ